jgi:hypothetical protein
LKGGTDLKTDDLKRLIKIGEVDDPNLVHVSVSKLKVWKSCQQKFNYKYVQKLKPKTKSRPLTLGGLVHKCLESHDEGENWVQVIKDYNTNEFSKLFLEEKAELGDIPHDCLRICRAYFNHYSEIDKYFDTICCEVGFQIRVPGTQIVIEGIIDKVARNNKTGKVWGFEHKTMKKDLPTETYRSTDIQTTVYEWALALMAPELGFEPKDLGGMMFDYLRTKPPTMPKLLLNKTMSKAKIDCDKWTYIEELKRNGLNPEDYKDFIATLDSNNSFSRIPLAKSKAMVKIMLQDFVNGVHQMVEWQDKPTRNLAWTCDRPKCDYRQLCLADIQGLDLKPIIDQFFEQKEEEENGQKSDDTESE